MGITGLLPFLQKSSHRANIKEYSGCTVAIDAYCWLHKGAFACAEKLVMNEPTTQYVAYCMKYVNMLLSHNIKPILVFDGQNLPAKAGTEQKRRQNRDVNRRKGVELLRAGRVSEGRNMLRRALDVTHLMALEVMKECRRINVDCIVAPFEADAQLAYFSLNDVAHVVITEDSDLILFGCKTVMFKMDMNGNGTVVDSSKLYLSMGVRKDLFSLDKFRLMAILSGCDYVDSLPGIGLAKACKFVNRTSETDIYKCLEKLSANLNMWNLDVSEEYKKSVVDADHTFRCQLVFDPKTRTQVALTTPWPGESPVGDIKDPATAFQLALGNLNPKNLQVVDNFDPDKHTVPRNQKGRAPHTSIWSTNYTRSALPKQNPPTIMRHITAGKSVLLDVKLSPAVKREVEEIPEDDVELSDVDLLRFYSNGNKRKKVISPTKPLQVSRYFQSNISDKENTPNAHKPSLLDLLTDDEDSPPSSSEYDTALSASSEYSTPLSSGQASRSSSDIKSCSTGFLDDLENLNIISKSQTVSSNEENMNLDIIQESPSMIDSITLKNKKLHDSSILAENDNCDIDDMQAYPEEKVIGCDDSENQCHESPSTNENILLHESPNDDSPKDSNVHECEESRRLSSPGLKAFHFKATTGQLPISYHPFGALTKLDTISTSTSVFFKTDSVVNRPLVGKARSSGLSRKKTVPVAKQGTLTKFGFQVLPKTSPLK